MRLSSDYNTYWTDRAMNIVENTNRRLVIEDETKRLVVIGASVALLLLCVFLVTMGLWTDGIIPGTSRFHEVEIEGNQHWWFTLGFGVCGLFCILGALLQSYSRIVFDKEEGYVAVVKIRAIGKATKRTALESVRRATVDSLGDAQRFEIELKTGEKLLPGGAYNNYDRPESLQKVADEVNAFLAGSRMSC